MANWINDPQNRENIEKVTEKLKLPLYKPSAKGKFRDWLRESWNKLEDYILSLKEILDGKEPAFEKKTAFNKNFGETAGTVLEGNKLDEINRRINDKVSKSGDIMTGNLIITRNQPHIALNDNRTGGVGGYIGFGSSEKRLQIINRHSDGVTEINAPNLETTSKEIVAAVNELKNKKFDCTGGNITGNVSIRGVLNITAGGNYWPKIKIHTNEGYWSFEANPNSQNSDERRLNLAYVSNEASDSTVYLRFPVVNNEGDTIAYQSWAYDLVCRGPYGVQEVGAGYTGNGGKQPPSYVSSGKVRFLMSNEEVNGNNSYKDWIYMDTYIAGDVPYTTAFGIKKDSGGMRAFLMRGRKGGSIWDSKEEIWHTGNLKKGSNILYDTKNGSSVVNLNISEYSYLIVSAYNYKNYECPATLPAISGTYMVGPSAGDSGNDYYIVRVESNRVSIVGVKNFKNRFTKVIGIY